MIPDIKYNLHDSSITGVQITPKSTVRFTIDLYSVFHPNIKSIFLTFEKIFNYDSVSTYAQKILDEAEPNEIGCRIDKFQYDTNKPSNLHDLWFYLATDWEGALRIHCESMSIEIIK